MGRTVNVGTGFDVGTGERTSTEGMKIESDSGVEALVKGFARLLWSNATEVISNVSRNHSVLKTQ